MRKARATGPRFMLLLTAALMLSIPHVVFGGPPDAGPAVRADPLTLMIDADGVRGVWEPLGLEVDDGLGDACAKPSQYISYRVTADNSANPEAVHGVVTISRLPRNMTFMTASGRADYDTIQHKVIWGIGRLEAAAAESLIIRVFVNYNTQPGASLVNRCEIHCAEAASAEAAETTMVCVDSVFMQDPLNLEMRCDLGDSCQVPAGHVRYVISFENPRSNERVDRVYVIHHLAPETECSGSPYPGTYQSSSHRVLWLFQSLDPGQRGSVSVTVAVKPGIQPGTRAVSSSSAHGSNLYRCETDGDTLTVCAERRAALRLAMELSPVTACVPRGNLSYTISYSNDLNAVEVHDVTLVDRLPDQCAFVSASGAGTYDPVSHSATWCVGAVPPGAQGTRELVLGVREETPSWSRFTNSAEIRGEGCPPDFADKTSLVCGAYGNPGFKIAIHVEPHRSRNCIEGMPSIAGRGDIESSTDSSDVDFFPVFFDLVEYRAMEYGIQWSDGSSCLFKSCCDISVGSISESGDGISHVWSMCRAGPVAIPGWGWIEFDGPNEIHLAPHPDTHEICVGDCQVWMSLDRPTHVYYAGVGGAPGGIGLLRQRETPTTWGHIKAMFK